MRDAFSTYHPVVEFLYFALVLLFTMCIMHPAALLLSLAGGFAWSVYLGGRRALLFNLAALLPVLLFTALLNPLFNHAGATVLWYFPWGNPLTLESILYGLAASAMLAAALLWFSCLNKVITSDKLVYLFGRAAPALSLLLSMVLRFVPRFKQRLVSVAAAQRCVGRGVSGGSLRARVSHGVRILSVLVTWALESAVDTADSMKGRGYGLPGRTAFSLYRFDRRDRAVLLWLLVLGGVLLLLSLLGAAYVRYYPTFRCAPLSLRSGCAFFAYALLCATPFVIDRREDRKWKRLRSKI